MSRMKKRILSAVILAVMVVLACVPAMGAEEVEERGAGERAAAVGTEAGGSVVRAFPSGAGILSVDIYPAKFQEKIYYQDTYTHKSGQERLQWLNITLDNSTAAEYNKNGCDAFYVKVTVRTGQALFYDTYANDILYNTGYCSRIPNAKLSVGIFVENKGTPNWKCVVYDSKNDASQSKPMWGYIYMP